MGISKSTVKMICENEYGRLKHVILCEPKHMSIDGNINETQKQFKDNQFRKHRAIKQHQHLIDTLIKHGVQVSLLPAHKYFPEQVFTRDIGFTVGHTIFVSNMAHESRVGEESIFASWLKSRQKPHCHFIDNHIEGGDVIVHDGQLFIGLSHRTNQQAINPIQKVLPKYKIIPVPFSKKYLHLDCVFNIISENEALYYPDAFQQPELDILAEQFDLIPVNDEEQFTLGTNVLSLGDKKILSLPINRQINQDLRNRGFEVIEVDISEIIKSGGSFRCCTLPLLRE
ncbi:dimethylarginine dimethylaminohydrolase family protein [Salipaludibacillus daqingensis]|uniref:dimethylarginine dimethylaminohydrolase family protein n=1 Tax=Salipaludibacillus daqingensis TaxID=3041001 RepID=UPI0024754B90|nr:dimethylarginine dimethylaminohydrolase family protein [Salipaludibacillus daqingensis]